MLRVNLVNPPIGGHLAEFSKQNLVQPSISVLLTLGSDWWTLIGISKGNVVELSINVR